jgi:hypothetical protein
MHTNFEPITKKKKIFKTKAFGLDQKSDVYQRTIGFTCLKCNFPVRSEIEFSGVLNRNHCPYCLWSRHVDHWQSGDRLSACKMSMQPIALTFKKSRNKYGSSRGELMIIHQCQACEAISINRIAADDNLEELLSIMKHVSKLSNHQNQQLETFGIEPVRQKDYHLVKMSLFGYSVKN